MEDYREIIADSNKPKYVINNIIDDFTGSVTFEEKRKAKQLSYSLGDRFQLYEISMNPQKASSEKGGKTADKIIDNLDDLDIQSEEVEIEEEEV